MLTSELERMRLIERRIKEIAEKEGLKTTEIDFEVVPAIRMIEAMAYHFPMNFSHWTFGRDYDSTRTKYEYTGQGIPYEAVWNFERPRAFLVANNPFALNVLTIAHVYGHVDFHLRNRFIRHGRKFADIAEEARDAANRFRTYESLYGIEVEHMIDSAMAIEWQQHPNPFFEEQDEEKVRQFLIAVEMEKLREVSKGGITKSQKAIDDERQKIEKKLRLLQHKTPPEPVYDLLKYITEQAPRLRPWQRDILRVVRNQARALAPQRRTQLLNEGWATYWHTRIMRQLFEEGLLTREEHGVFLEFHSAVLRSSKVDFNVYSIGPALFEYIKMRWDKGRFGKDYDECRDPIKKAWWDTEVMQGTAKIFEVATECSSREAVEEYFTDEFIHGMGLYIFEAQHNAEKEEMEYVIIEKDPEVIRVTIRNVFTLFNQPVISITNGNYNDRGELYLLHHYQGQELQPRFRNGALEHVARLWGRAVHIETVVDKKAKLFTYDPVRKKHTEA